MRNLKKADVSGDFIDHRVPDEAARLSAGQDAIVALLRMPFSDLIKGGRTGARKKDEREQYPGLEALINQHIPGLPQDFASKLNLPVWYYLQGHMIKATVDPETGSDVLFVILKREKPKGAPDEVYTILDITNRTIKEVGATDPLFNGAKNIHVIEQTQKLEEINKLAAKYDEFMSKLNRHNSSQSLTAWCPMMMKSIKLANDRKFQLALQKNAMDTREGSSKADIRMDAEARFRGGEDDAFARALTNQGFFKQVEDVIIHIMSKYPVSKMGQLSEGIRNGTINFPFLVANLTPQMGAQRAQATVQGIMNFIQDMASRMQEHYDNNLESTKDRQKSIANPQAGDVELPNIPDQMGQFGIEDMPSWVHGRLQGFTNSMENYEAQGGAMSASINAEMKALDSLIEHLQIAHQIICADPNFPKNRAALANSPNDVATISSAKKVVVDYFQKYSSDFFVQDGDRKRIDKRKIGSSEPRKSMANLLLATYLHQIWNYMNKMGY
jgi:hypothetical protein